MLLLPLLLATTIQPYLNLQQDGELALVFEAPYEVKLHLEDGRVLDARTERRDGLWRAPLERCDLVAYQIDDAAPVEVHLPKCGGETARIGFLTDTQYDAEIARKAAEALAPHAPELLLHGGDIVQVASDDASWRAVLEALRPVTAQAPILPALGNHDTYGDPEGQAVKRYFGLRAERAWSARRVGPVQLILLDSKLANEVGTPRALAQKAFLAQALESDAAWKVVVMHHPMFSAGFGTAWWAPRLFGDERVLQAELLDTLESSGVDLVITGHTHLFERSRKDAVEYLGGGPAGGLLGYLGGENPHMLRAERERTVSLVDASPDELIVRTYDLDGELLDTIRRTREASPLLSARDPIPGRACFRPQ